MSTLPKTRPNYPRQPDDPRRINGASHLVGRLRERERELAAVEVLLEHRGGMLVVEGRAGIGKTSLVEVACSRADELGHEVIRARGSVPAVAPG